MSLPQLQIGNTRARTPTRSVSPSEIFKYVDPIADNRPKRPPTGAKTVSPVGNYKPRVRNMSMFTERIRSVKDETLNKDMFGSYLTDMSKFKFRAEPDKNLEPFVTNFTNSSVLSPQPQRQITSRGTAGRAKTAPQLRSRPDPQAGTASAASVEAPPSSGSVCSLNSAGLPQESTELVFMDGQNMQMLCIGRDDEERDEYPDEERQGEQKSREIKVTKHAPLMARPPAALQPLPMLSPSRPKSSSSPHRPHLMEKQLPYSIHTTTRRSS